MGRTWLRRSELGVGRLKVPCAVEQRAYETLKLMEKLEGGIRVENFVKEKGVGEGWKCGAVQNIE